MPQLVSRGRLQRAADFFEQDQINRVRPHLQHMSPQTARVRSHSVCDSPQKNGDNSDAFSQARIFVQGRCQGMLEEIFSCFSVPDLTDPQGNTLLHVACQNGNKRALRFLLKQGCDINAQNRNGNTPLHYAYAYKYIELATYLESKGADGKIANLHLLLPHECLDCGLKPALLPRDPREIQREKARRNSVPNLPIHGRPDPRALVSEVVVGALEEANVAKAVALQMEEENKLLRRAMEAAKQEVKALAEREEKQQRICLLQDKLLQVEKLRMKALSEEQEHLPSMDQQIEVKAMNSDDVAPHVKAYRAGAEASQDKENIENYKDIQNQFIKDCGAHGGAEKPKKKGLQQPQPPAFLQPRQEKKPQPPPRPARYNEGPMPGLNRVIAMARMRVD